MNKKIIPLLIISLVFTVVTGCNKENKVESVDKTTPPSIVINNDSKDNEPIEVVEEIVKVKSPLNGEMVKPKDINDRVIAVMIDNQEDARPQAGLSQFDIVYEILAEGSITRYLGIIGTQQPKNIGPVRSARDYFILRAMEYDSLYVHVGGSTQGYDALAKYNTPTIDGMHLGGETFWRSSHRVPPHNTYSKYSGIIKAANRYKYRTTGEYDTLKFSDIEKEIVGTLAMDLSFKYSNIYKSSYKYDESEKVYYRFINGEQLVDENDDTKIYAKNIIVQFTETKPIPNDPYKKITVEMVGEGDGYYITNGLKQDITWKKESNSDLTRYYDSKGKELILNPGKIWIQVFPDNKVENITIM